MWNRSLLVSALLAIIAAMPIEFSARADDAHHALGAATQAAPAQAPARQPGQGMMGGQGGMMGGQGMMGPGMMMGMTGGMGGMTDHVEGRIAFLRTELKITDAQARPWNEFANALRENAKRLNDVRMKTESQPSLSQALEQEERVLRVRSDGLATLKIVYGHLESVLSAEQKKLAESLLPPHLGLRSGTMM